MDPKSFPPRFILQGTVLNVFLTPEGERDGQKFGGDYRLQLMSADHLRNGETKLVPTEVNIGSDRAEAETYRTQIGETVKVPVSVYVVGRDVRCTLARERAA